MAGPTLPDLIASGRCASVTQECQGAVVGPHAGLAELATEARREAIPNIVRLVEAARSAGVSVLHCLAHRRFDGLGANHNARLFAGVENLGMDMTPGSAGGSLLPELGPEPGDIVLTRLHGLGPMGGTDLDAVLRNLDVRVVIGVGVSVNVAIVNFAMDAVNAGYQFVLPRDAVAGVPRAYADDVIANTLSLIATVVTTDQIVSAWT